MQRSYASDGCLSWVGFCACVFVCVREERLNPGSVLKNLLYVSHVPACTCVCARVCASRVESNCTHATIDHSTVRGVTVLPGDGGPAARCALVSLSEVSRSSRMSALDIWHSSRTAADTTSRLGEKMCISLHNLTHFTKIPGCMKFDVKISLLWVSVNASFLRPAALLTTNSDM